MKITINHFCSKSIYCVGKVPHWYYVQEGDATMLTDASRPGQQNTFIVEA